MATVERIELDPATPPERLPYDAVWVVLPKEPAAKDVSKDPKFRPFRDEFLKWLDWRSLGQLSQAAVRPADVPTFVALGPEMPVRWLMVDRSAPVNADALYRACQELGLERLLVVAEEASLRVPCEEALTRTPAAKAASSIYVAVLGEAT